MKKLIAFVLSFILALSCLTGVVATSEIDDKLFIDYSNAEHGTVNVSVVDPEPTRNYKLRVTLEDKYYNYDVSTGIEMTVVPLQMGSGTYQIELYEHVYDDIYQFTGGKELTVEVDKHDVWLQSNVKVDFSSPERLLEELSNIVSLSDTELEKYNKITMYILRHYGYDWMAVYNETVPKNADLNRVLERKFGTCEELSALTVALLRLSGIQSRLVIGYLNGSCHA